MISDTYKAIKKLFYLAKVNSRKQKIKLLREIFSDIDKINKLIYMLQGNIEPEHKSKNFNLSEQSIKAILSDLLNQHISKINQLYIKHGNFVDIINKHHKGKSRNITIEQIYDFLHNLTNISNKREKYAYFVKFTKNLDPIIVSFIINVILDKFRLGIGDSIILQALYELYSTSHTKKQVSLTIDDFEKFYAMTNDLGLLAKYIKAQDYDKIKSLKTILGSPVHCMLPKRASSFEEVLQKIKDCAVEYKYDGLRIQVHKLNNGDIIMYSRNLKNVTNMFPTIKSAIEKELKHLKNFILDGELVLYNKDKDYYPDFQNILTLKRKHDIDKITKIHDDKLVFVVFDIIYLNDNLVANRPYKDRRLILENIIKERQKILLSTKYEITVVVELKKVFREAISKNLEGLVCKNMNSKYEFGKRTYNWIKLKRVFSNKVKDTIDVVVIGYYHGTGIHKNMIGSLLVGLYNSADNKIYAFTKVGSGINLSLAKSLKKLLDKYKTNDKPINVVSTKVKPDIWVEPKIVITIDTDQITKSSNYDVGYSARAPRFINIRLDKNIEQANTVDDIKDFT